jgi:hypothetical protein
MGSIPGRWDKKLAETLTRFENGKLTTSRGADPDHVKDCAIRKVGLQFAGKVNPTANLREVFDALDMIRNCNMTAKDRDALPGSKKTADFPIPTGALKCFVDPSAGSDETGACGASEGESMAFLTVNAAVAASRTSSANTTGKVVVLKKGVHFLKETIQLGPADSGLIIQNYGGDEAWISGGKPLLKPEWHSYKNGIYYTDITDDSIANITGLNTLSSPEFGTVGSAFKRLTRARFPNADPGSGSAENGWITDDDNTSWVHPTHPAKATQVALGEVKTDAVEYNQYVYGIGGECSMYAEGGAYLCSNQVSRLQVRQLIRIYTITN